jgi:ABC-type sugar transport system permease subunit
VVLSKGQVRNRIKDAAQAYLFLLPMILFLCYFLYRSILGTIGYSFLRFVNFVPRNFVGFQNYIELFSDMQFWNGLRLTFIWAFLSAGLLTLSGLILALLLEFFTKSSILSGLSRTLLFMPEIMSLVAAGLLWSLIYNPNIGVITGLMHVFGSTEKFRPYASVDTAIYVAFLPTIWKSCGFSMIIFSAALQGVSQDIVESAIVEGANKFQQIMYVILPSIVKTITMVFLLNLISGFKAFDFLYALTGGGPGMSTKVTSLYAYETAFSVFRFDYAGAMLSFMLACVVVIVMVYNLAVSRLESKLGA